MGGISSYLKGQEGGGSGSGSGQFAWRDGKEGGRREGCPRHLGPVAGFASGLRRHRAQICRGYAGRAAYVPFRLSALAAPALQSCHKFPPATMGARPLINKPPLPVLRSFSVVLV